MPDSAQVHDPLRPPARRRAIPRRRRLLYIGLINLVILCAAALIAEVWLRRHHLGGWTSAFKSLLVDVKPNYHGNDRWLISDPELGYTLNPHHRNVNGLGIRHSPITTPRPSGVFRVLVIGDSVAWDEDGFVSMLAGRLERDSPGRFEVINAAIPGYTTFQQRGLLDRLLPHVEPDLVLLQYCLNDHHKFLHELNADGRWLITQQARHALAADDDGWTAWLSRRSYLALTVRLSWVRVRARGGGSLPWQVDAGFRPAWEDVSWPIFAEHLTAMRDRAAGIDASLVVAVFPIERQLDAALSEVADLLKPQQKVRSVCAELDVERLDLTPLFTVHRDRRLFRDGLHLTPAGHELAAEALHEFLQPRLGRESSAGRAP